MAVKISVVTPSYNQAAYLEQTLRSVLAQRALIHEYFVIDGGSDDGSAEIIREHAGAGIDHWVSEPDQGQCDAIDKGFARATGDVLYWINSDDVLLPGAIERVRAAFEARPRPDVVSGWGVGIDGDGRVVQMRRRVHDSPWWGRLGYLRVHQPCTFFSKALYDSVGGLDRDLHCVLDTDLWYRMYRAGSRWAGVDAYLAAYRLHPQAKGATLGERYAQERRLMKDRYPELTRSKLRHTLGRLAYYASQLASGRTIASMRDLRRARGRPLSGVFADGGGPERGSAAGRARR